MATPMTPTDRTSGPAADASAGQTPITELVSGIVSDAQTLIKQQVVMLRTEFKEDMRRTKDAAKFMGLGGALLSLGGLFLVVSLVYTLQWLFPELHLAACWAIVGGTLAVAGLLAVLAGKRMFDKFNPLPDKTANALQENVSWLTNPRS